MSSVPGEDLPLQYTHSGSRYLLGYGRDFFGIWDRQAPAHPVARYPRSDDGWREAWLEFAAREPHSSEVGIGEPMPTWTAGAAATPAAPRRVHRAWWLLPILMGWLGGVIAWLANRDVDPRVARAMLFTGIGISAAIVLVYSTASSS